MAITAPSLRQISAIGGFSYTTKAAQPLKDFCDNVQTDAITATSYQIANARQYAPSTFASASLNAAATYTNYPFVANAAATVVSAKVVFTGTPSVQPGVAPNDLVLTVYKNGATVVATKTYTAAVDAAGTWVALTLSGTAANLNLAANDTLTYEVKQNGTTRVGTASGINFLVAMVPKAT
jgi:hypothetical protein